MLDLDTLAAKVAKGKIDTVIMCFTDHYGRLVGKRLDAEFFLDGAAKDGSHACDYLLTTDMEMEPVSGYRFANWELGYGDFPSIARSLIATQSYLAQEHRAGDVRR